jgi:ABC-type multidrug transport system ATPase subunit
MDLMAGRRHVGVMCGNITFDYSSSQCSIGYCQSSDLHIGELTVYQNLFYSCQLRSLMPLTSQQIYDRCHHVAKIVGLDSAFNTTVGNILIKGISGGQQKLLSIATELLGNPQVLFLDEVIISLSSAYSSLLTLLLSSPFSIVSANHWFRFHDFSLCHENSSQSC